MNLTSEEAQMDVAALSLSLWDKGYARQGEYAIDNETNTEEIKTFVLWSNGDTTLCRIYFWDDHHEVWMSPAIERKTARDVGKELCDRGYREVSWHNIDHGTRAHYAELGWPNLLHMSIHSNGQDTLRLIVSADGDRVLLFERICGDDVESIVRQIP
jgi:hypothetical protein